MNAGWDQSKDAAESMGLKPVTYRSYERPTSEAGRGMKPQQAQQFARKFKVSWTWLLMGEGTPAIETQAPPELVEINRRIESMTDPAQRTNALDLINGILDVVERKTG